MATTELATEPRDNQPDPGSELADNSPVREGFFKRIWTGIKYIFKGSELPSADKPATGETLTNEERQRRGLVEMAANIVGELDQDFKSKKDRGRELGRHLSGLTKDSVDRVTEALSGNVITQDENTVILELIRDNLTKLKDNVIDILSTAESPEAKSENVVRAIENCLSTCKQDVSGFVTSGESRLSTVQAIFGQYLESTPTAKQDKQEFLERFSGFGPVTNDFKEIAGNLYDAHDKAESVRQKEVAEKRLKYLREEARKVALANIDNSDEAGLEAIVSGSTPQP